MRSRRSLLFALVVVAMMAIACSSDVFEVEEATDWTPDVPFATWTPQGIDTRLTLHVGLVEFADDCIIYTPPGRDESASATVVLPDQGDLSWSEETQQLLVGDHVFRSGTAVKIGGGSIVAATELDSSSPTCTDRAILARSIRVDDSN